MKAIVDENSCTSCGLCEDICPEVFKVEDVTKVLVDQVPQDAEESCRQASDSCPTDAISIKD